MPSTQSTPDKSSPPDVLVAIAFEISATLAPAGTDTHRYGIHARVVSGSTPHNGTLVNAH
jgi:hypothetical protein